MEADRDTSRTSPADVRQSSSAQPPKQTLSIQTQDCQFFGNFENDNKGDSDNDLMCLSIKVVSHLLYEKDDNEVERTIKVVVKSANSFIKLTVDTGSPSSFLNKRTAKQILTTNPDAKFCPVEKLKDYVRHIDYNDQTIKVLGQLTVPVSSAGWKVDNAKFLVVERARCLLGLDLHKSLGVRTNQTSYGDYLKEVSKEGNPNKVNSVELPNTDQWVSENWKNNHSTKFAHVFNRQGRSKNHVVTTNFFSPLIPIQEKGRRIPIHILNRVEKEIDKLQKDDMITKLDKCTNDFFIAPIVITAKTDGSIKLALDAKPINFQIHKTSTKFPLLMYFSIMLDRS